MGATHLETMSVSRRETGRLHMWVMSSMTSLVTCITLTSHTSPSIMASLSLIIMCVAHLD